MGEEYQYPQANDTDEYCLFHNIKFSDYLNSCPICDGDLVLAFNEGIHIPVPTQFYHLYLLYQNLAFASLALIFLFLSELLYFPSVILFMLALAYFFYRVAGGVLEFSGFGYRLLGILTGIAVLFALFSYMITLNLMTSIIPLTIFVILFLFSFYVYGNRTVSGIMNLSTVMTQKLLKQQETIIKSRSKEENFTRHFPSILLAISLLFLVPLMRLIVQ